MPKKTTKKKEEKKKYVASAKIMGQVFKGEGETVYEAIGNIQPGAVAGMVILTVERDGNSKERIMPMNVARRTFKTLGMTREIALEAQSKMFEGI